MNMITAVFVGRCIYRIPSPNIAGPLLVERYEAQQELITAVKAVILIDFFRLLARQLYGGIVSASNGWCWLLSFLLF